MNLLEVRDAAVVFGGLRAVDGVSLDVAEGAIVGLIGPNGAGKTTCFNAISGLQALTSGTVSFRGKDVTALPAHERAARGIGRSFQHLGLMLEETVLTNVLAAQHLGAGYSGVHVALRPVRWWRRERELAARANEVLESIGLSEHRDRAVRDLSFAGARAVELAAVLACASGGGRGVESPALMLLDEPTTGLDVAEIEDLRVALRRANEGGTTILVIAHDVGFVMGLCDEVHVLARGQLLSSGTPEQVRNDPAVVEAYLGERGVTSVLDVVDLTTGYVRAPVLRDVSFSLGEEILGVLGANGAGKTTLLRTLSGNLRPWSGEVSLHGSTLGRTTPWARARRGLAHVPEGRHVFGPLSVDDNLDIAALTGREQRFTKQRVFELFPRLLERRAQAAGSLSGGEQQMLVIGRALLTGPSVLLVDELSAGLAPVTARELVESLVAIHREGVAMILVEQSPRLIADVVDRVIVLEHGGVGAEGTIDEVGGADGLADRYLASR